MKFKGTDSPKVYIIDFHKEDNPEEEYPMSGVRGAYVTSLLGSFSILDQVRIANWVEQGKSVVVEDIKSTKPEVVVAFGSEALNEFTNTGRKITDVSGTVFDYDFDGYETKLLVVMSPSYVINRTGDQSVALRFSQDLYKAFQIINGEYKDILKEKIILSAHSFAEFKEIYDKYFKDDFRLAYDIETNARPPMFAGSRIIGFSIGNKKAGVYVSIDSLDFHMNEFDEDDIWDFLINKVFLKESRMTNRSMRLIIHNTMYERPYTLYCKGYEIPFDKADDTLVKSRLLRSPKESAGLKYQAQKNLHYPDWETDLQTYIGGISDFVNRIGLGPKKYSQGIFYELSTTCNNIFDIKNTASFKDLSEVDQLEVRNIIGKIYFPLCDLYSEDEITDLGKLIRNIVVECVNTGGIKDSTIPFNWIPDRLLSKYGAVDSLATFDLDDFYNEMMDRESTDKVDLHKGYRNWLEHMYVAYIMERNGMYWNDEVASKDREFLSKQATECLRSMLKSPCFAPFVSSSCSWKYKPIILADYLPEIARSQGYEVVYDHITDKFTLYKDGKRIQKGRLDEIEISYYYQDEYDNIMWRMFCEEVDSAKDYEELKSIYSPTSTSEDQTIIPRKILINDTLQMGGRINNLHTLSSSPEFETVKSSGLLNAIDNKFLQIADLLCSPDELKHTYGKDWAKARKSLYEVFCNMYAMCRSNVSCLEISSILKEPHPIDVESFDDGGVIAIYDNLVVTGIDQDDRSTWTPEFEWMVNFRLYKKSVKIISSYIDGSVGRESVAVVNKESVRRGDHCVERLDRYFDRHGHITSNEDYLLCAKWSPNTAETGRWRSAQHTIPWGSQVKKYYTSRFVGGTTCCPDYSQMEVRTLAAISKDKNMLELFHSGKDFHTETAKKIYRKDEVTAAERRFSKTATFSLLYGAMEESFARNYCKDDMDYARMVYGGFFEAYPDVKRWVEERHEEVQRDHRVSLELSGRFIQINPDGEGRGAINSMLRKSQNYPIQAQSADLTGCVIFDLQQYIEENNLKSLVFMYVHDSIEVDIYPYELFQFISKLKVLLNESPMRRMGLPSKADVALGKSLGHEIEMESIEVNDDMTEGTMVLKGFKDEIDDTVENWKKAYALVEVSDENYKEEYVSMGDLFILKKAYTPTLGTLRHKGTCKVHIKYYD